MHPLNNYWDNHLRVAFEQSAGHDLPAMVEASLAHVAMLAKTGALSAERAAVLQTGLVRLWRRWQNGCATPAFDGSVEDPYYYFEQQLALELAMPVADLDIQLARSRNDLDAAVFRMILRRMTLGHADQLAQLIEVTLTAAQRHVDAVIIGMTHRRPAQPTTIAHVLVGLADAWTACLRDAVQTFDELNHSPLGGAAFAGTDISYDANLVAALLGFDDTYNSSYEAIAGAGHFGRVASLHARIAAQSARWARVLQEWMSLGWIMTPLGFTQGSSIMPQKVNPVVCEHLASMAGATLGDAQAVMVNIAQSWYEDSNNATTDVRQHLWRSAERLKRVLNLQHGLAQEIAVKQLPEPDVIVASGATTTAVAEALSLAEVPWRLAHDIVHDLVQANPPQQWTQNQVSARLTASGIDASLAERLLAVAKQPALILDRTQSGSPGRKPMQAAVRDASACLDTLRAEVGARRIRIDDARHQLVEIAEHMADG